MRKCPPSPSQPGVFSCSTSPGIKLVSNTKPMSQEIAIAGPVLPPPSS